MIKEYIKDIFNTTKIGDAREESYYPDLKKLLDRFSESLKTDFLITALPRKTIGGNPDFRILTARKELVGYIEVKTFETEDLDNIEDTEQLKRYRSTFPNLILTNLFEFRLYRDGQLIDKVSIGRPFVIHQLNMAPPAKNEDKLIKILEQFFSFSIPITATARSLAVELAKRTRFLRDNVIAEELKEENIEGTQTLEGFYKAFKDHLIPSLEPSDFANLFAQTITYGLFAARSRAKEDFNRELAYKYIPPTIGILKDVFRFISSTNLPRSMEWIVDDIAEVLRCSNVKNIMENFYKEGKGRDPIIHFYETFLAEYDPKEREKRGVYYTPEPVVSYITRSIHKLLKEKFNKGDGFADKSVIVLDPAAGTLTFPAYAIDLAISEFKEKYGEGGISSLIKDHILKDFYAFELMMAPYAIGHLKIGLILDNLGYQLSDEERFNLFLTNTLDFSKEDPNRFPGVFEQTIAKESLEALNVKEDTPVFVVFGNPPYSSSHSEQSEFVKKTLEYYSTGLGVENEKRKGVLQDDYIRFIRFAHWKIAKNGVGVIGMITNNSYLDGIIHRAMRKKLMDDFSEIYIFNLHGNSRIKETTPEGGKDENVFDIQQGVSIAIFLKTDQDSPCKVYYKDIYGLRTNKYDSLNKSVIDQKDFELIKPQPNEYNFAKQDYSLKSKWDSLTGIDQIFSQFVSGVQTKRDNLVIDFENYNLKNKIRLFQNAVGNDEMLMRSFNLSEKSDLNIISAKKKLENIDIGTKIMTYSYHPFDNRWVFYDESLVSRTRKPLMDNMSKKNFGILLMRRTGNKEFNHVFITNGLADINFYGFQTYIFPLYIYDEDNNQNHLFENSQNRTSHQNFTKEFIDFIYKDDLTQILPEDVFYYIYAALYSNVYRKKYQEFLKIDFPKIPFTKNYQLFRKLAGLGQKLSDLHLLKAKEIDKPIVKFKGEGNSRIEKIDYLAMKMDNLVGGSVWINEKQRFDGVNEFLWNYHIGGYQVLNKWLKDRKGRILSAEEIKTYCKIATAIHYTILIQKDIDKLYPEVEKTLISP
jgi:predicted helicase